mmetsp:Transcript_17337/g.40243  ORF Transcript_17337/g.40243 Transcript_17337/m.40243 type:complete len:126 (-) Transcript_17337:1221-1598(-)
MVLNSGYVMYVNVCVCVLVFGMRLCVKTSYCRVSDPGSPISSQCNPVDHILHTSIGGGVGCGHDCDHSSLSEGVSSAKSISTLVNSTKYEVDSQGVLAIFLVYGCILCDLTICIVFVLLEIQIRS